MSLEQDGDLERFLHVWEMMYIKLEDNGFKFEEKFKVMLLLGSLPESY